MTFSKETIDLILDIKEYANGKIKNDFDLSVLLEKGFFTDKKYVFRDLIFKAKFMNGMFGIITDEVNQDKMDKLMPEFTRNLEEFIGLLQNTLADADRESRDYFSGKYFEMKTEIIEEYISLITDLSVCKDFFNDRKYTGG